MKTCIFCKSDLAVSGRAKEHIVPRWLQEAWGLSEHIIEPTHFDEVGGVKSSRRHVLDSFLSGKVCAKCNNGWMSQLEVECKSLILSLAHDKRRILSLEDGEALLLARWAVKTAYSLHASANWRKVIPAEHYTVLDKAEYRLPRGVFVVGHTYKFSSTFSWTQSTTWEINYRGVEISDAEKADLQRTGYKISLRIGGLFVTVFHVPLERALPCLWKFRHVPLYPRWSHPVMWQVDDQAWPSNVEARFQIFHELLSLNIDGNGED